MALKKDYLRRRILHFQRKFFSIGKVRTTVFFFFYDWSHLNVVGYSALSSWKHTLASWIFFFSQNKKLTISKRTCSAFLENANKEYNNKDLVRCLSLNGRCHARQKMCCRRVASFLISCVMSTRTYLECAFIHLVDDYNGKVTRKKTKTLMHFNKTNQCPQTLHWGKWKVFAKLSLLLSDCCKTWWYLWSTLLRISLKTFISFIACIEIFWKHDKIDFSLQKI